MEPLTTLTPAHVGKRLRVEIDGPVHMTIEATLAGLHATADRIEVVTADRALGPVVSTLGHIRVEVTLVSGTNEFILHADHRVTWSEA